MLYRDFFELETETNNFYNITDRITEIIKKSSLQDGLCNIFLPSTTAGLMINENDRMLNEDFRRVFNELAPETRLYFHPENAQSHIRASLLTQNITLSFANGKLLLGTWQNILLWEFDLKPRQRKVVVTLVY